MSNNLPCAKVRIFLPTYRRNHLLKRAVASLRSQTFTDWICEVHNDDPGDPEPANLLASITDPRFTLRQHELNLGGTGTFNLFYEGVSEPFYSILEDDNWWKPEFLEIMLETAEANPDVTVFWSNQSCWKEHPDGSFQDTGRLVRPYLQGARPQRIEWGQTSQIYGAMHANGAALFRSKPNQNFVIPHVPFAGIELFRERMFPHPMIFVPEPLANFSITLQSHRSDRAAEWATVQVMIAASFLKYAQYDEARLRDLWRAARANHPPSTNTLIYASLIEPSCSQIRQYAQLVDWLLFFRGMVGHPHIPWNIFNCKRRHPEWWTFLDKHTADRFHPATGSVRKEQI